MRAIVSFADSSHGRLFVAASMALIAPLLMSLAVRIMMRIA